MKDDFDNNQNIDIHFSVFTDANGKDPDSYSKTLNHYHYLLWRKILPNGERFQLEKLGKKRFLLVYDTGQEKYHFSSDSILSSYIDWKSMKHIVSQIPYEELRAYRNQISTIGGYLIFPAKTVNRKPTINGMRGMHFLIKDRFDYTLECIRRWYLGMASPLYDVIDRYKWFFNYFIDFQGYVDFFLLNDLVDDQGHIRFWLPFKDFGISNPLPQSVEEYRVYLRNIVSTAIARNERILRWCQENLIACK